VFDRKLISTIVSFVKTLQLKQANLLNAKRKYLQEIGVIFLKTLYSLYTQFHLTISMKIIILCLLVIIPIHLNASEPYLPESANPRTYVQISDCYAHDDVTAYTTQGLILGDWDDWKGIRILVDGCTILHRGGYLYSGQHFAYWDHSRDEQVIVTPDARTFRVIHTQSGALLWIDKNYIFHGNVAFRIPKDFDISKMKYLQYDYMTDGKNLYYMGSADGTILRIEGIDIPSFWVFESSMWKRFLYDKNGAYNDAFVPSKQRAQDESHIWYVSSKWMKQYSSYDFQTLTESWIFIFDSKNIYSPDISVGVDMKTFRLFPDGQLAWDKNHIFTPTGKVIEGIDTWSYEYIGNGVVKSRWKLFVGCKNEIGCDGYELTGFDVDTFHQTDSGFADANNDYDPYFRPIQKRISPMIAYSGSSYYHDVKNIFFQPWSDQYDILTGAHIGTFVAFSGTLYAKDSGSCWFEWISFDCNSKTFRAFEAWRALDSTSVYYQNKKIIGADPKSFTGIYTWGFNWIETHHYMRDKSRVYYDDRPILDSDPNTFVLMKDLHSKDKNNIYYAGWKIEWSDYKTYIPLRYSFARDKNHFYFAGTRLELIKYPKAVEIVSRESLRYNGYIRQYWCFGSISSDVHSMCNE
jgi:DKNYY family